MAESVNGGNKPLLPRKEIPMEARLLLAFLLMGVVMFLTPYLFKSANPPPANKTAPAAETKAPPPAAPAEAAPVVPAAAITRPATAKTATPQRTLPHFIIDTELYRVALSNQGGSVRSWLLKKYMGNDGKPLELVNVAGAPVPPLSLYFPNLKPESDVNWTWYQQSGDPDGLGVTYTWSDGRTSVRKVFRFHKNSYLSTIETEVTIDGKPVPHMVQWRGGFGDLTLEGNAGHQRTLYFDVSQNKLIEQNAGAASKGPVTAGGNFSFAGIADTFFAAVFIPLGTGPMQEVTFSDSVRTARDEKLQPFPGVAVSDGDPHRFELFVGPKDVDLLKQINPKLEQVVDFGWLSFLAKPLFLIVNWFNDQWVHNFGWSIVIVTIVLNFLLFPLKLSSMKSMLKMQGLKPQIDAINLKYKNLKITDPRKSEQNQEVMALYKKHGVNPMGGCFPMLLQIPFFFAFYTVFTVSVEMRGANWLWVRDLSQPEHLPIKILPIIMIASQFWMQHMTPSTTMDPNQARMMKWMPLIFGFMFYNFPSGLVLYYLTSNLVAIGQQWFFNRMHAAQAAPPAAGTATKKIARK
jgi:YidC/Oxa1 family membrane protein insertase